MSRLSHDPTPIPPAAPNPAGRQHFRAVIQARLSSTRLPGKAMLSIGGRPMVQLTAERVGRDGDEVMIATSDESHDDPIAELAAAQRIAYVRGSLADPLARFALATKDMADDDIVVRLTGDNVVPDAGLVHELVDSMTAAGASYVRIGGPDGGVPYGVAAEAFPVGLLRRADAEATEQPDREHVTPLIRRICGDRLLVPADVPPTWADLRCTVDVLDDFGPVWQLFAAQPDPIAATWRELCARLTDTAASWVV